MAMTPFDISDPADETTRLVCADWLDEKNRPEAAYRLRWWVNARAKVREGVMWDDQVADLGEAEAAAAALPEWARRLWRVELLRLIRERYPLASEWDHLTAVADATLCVAERYFLLLADDREREAEEEAAWSAAAEAEKAHHQMRRVTPVVSASQVGSASWAACAATRGASKAAGRRAADVAEALWWAACAAWYGVVEEVADGMVPVARSAAGRAGVSAELSAARILAALVPRRA